MSAQSGHHDLRRQFCLVLTPNFCARLKEANDATRELRGRGLRVVSIGIAPGNRVEPSRLVVAGAGAQEPIDLPNVTVVRIVAGTKP